MIWHRNELFSLLFIIQKYPHNLTEMLTFLLFSIMKFDFVIPMPLDSVKLNMFSARYMHTSNH